MRIDARYASVRRVAKALCFLCLAGQGAADAREPYASTYKVPDHPPVLIEDATLLTGTGARIDGADIMLSDGMIDAVGIDLDGSKNGLIRIDGTGLWVTPGLIDVHSHLGNYPAPSVASTADGNEITGPNTAHVWAEHSVWPQDPQFGLARAGGVTALMILPGSANLFGGRTVTLKNVPGRSVYDMKFPDAPHGLKVACGENPKRVYGERLQAPMTRMGNVAGYRRAWIDAEAYRDSWRRYHEQLAIHEAALEQDMEDDPPASPQPPKRDLGLETLAGVLDGEIPVHIHCYRADEMLVMLDIAKEFNYEVSTFHHAVESYKIADHLAQEGVCSAVWADWWGFKLEAWDMVVENAALIDKAGACAIIHSDDPHDIQRLNQEAAKAMAAGQRRGMDIDEADAIRWITQKPAEAMGIDDVTGTLEAGKAADIVLWNANPMSVYARAEQVFIDGTLVYDRNEPSRENVSDFDLGQTYLGTRP